MNVNGAALEAGQHVRREKQRQDPEVGPGSCAFGTRLPQTAAAARANPAFIYSLPACVWLHRVK